MYANDRNDRRRLIIKEANFSYKETVLKDGSVDFSVDRLNPLKVKIGENYYSFENTSTVKLNRFMNRVENNKLILEEYGRANPHLTKEDLEKLQFHFNRGYELDDYKFTLNRQLQQNLKEIQRNNNNYNTLVFQNKIIFYTVFTITSAIVLGSLAYMLPLFMSVAIPT